MRTRGYSAFSYADLSELVGIRKASIHHHFPTKEVLGGALIDSYLAKFEIELEEILKNEPEATKRLLQYGEFFVASRRGGLLPLCGALAAEMSVLPETMQHRVRYFFELHLNWLHAVLKDGMEAGELRRDIDINQASWLVLSTMEGASFVTWATETKNKNDNMILKTLEHVIAGLQPESSGDDQKG